MRRVIPLTWNCEYCGQPFKPTYVHKSPIKHTVYCSKQCFNAAKLADNIGRKCAICGSDTTRADKRGYLHWIPKPDDREKHICYACWAKHYRTKRSKEKNRFYNNRLNPIFQARRITFQNKRISLDSDIRVDVCNWCRAVKGQINAQNGRLVKTTHMHHEQYDENMPAAHTIEICEYCHPKETWRQRRKRSAT